MPSTKPRVCEHTDKKIYAKGMCRSCYEKDLRKRNPEYAERQRENNRAWKSDPENLERKRERDRVHQKNRGSRAHRKYRLSREKYDWYMSQPCGICGAKSEALDHDHKCCKDGCPNCVRGGLCRRCNIGLGYFEGWLTEHAEAIAYWIASHQRPNERRLVNG